MNTRAAHAARVYDYWLGGKDNYAVDRETGDAVVAAYPGLTASVRTNRAFHDRAVHYLAAEAGIRQFLDIGSGLPSADRNTHELEQAIAPGCRVVYVDNDPVVVAHARAMLASGPQGAIACIDADLRDPDGIVARAAQTLDFSQPIAILLLAVLHLVADDDAPHEIVARLIAAASPGSCLAVSHAASDLDSEQHAEAAKRFSKLTGEPVTLRPRDEVQRFFHGLNMVAPGLVCAPEWRPGSEADACAASSVWAGVALTQLQPADLDPAGTPRLRWAATPPYGTGHRVDTHTGR